MIITETTHLVVGLINILWMLFIVTFAAIPIYIIMRHYPIATFSTVLILAGAYLIGSFTCIEIKTNKKYESPTKD